MKNLTLTAYPVHQGKSTFYQTAIPAEVLTDSAQWKIDRWDFTSKEGYQREINQSHAHRLARYLGKAYLQDDGPSGHVMGQTNSDNPKPGITNVLPSSIVINFRNPLEVKELEGGAVSITLERWPAYVIDGQHRIEAIRELVEAGIDVSDYEFPVTLTQFSLEDEMVHFRNLNTTANRPPKGLNEAITHQLYSKYNRAPSTWGEVSATRATGITMRIASDLDSPWYGRIALGGVRKRAMHSIVQSQFSQSIRGSFISGRFSDPSENLDNVYSLIRNYWAAIAEVWPEAMGNPESSLIQRPSGTFPLNRVLERIFSNLSLNPSKKDFVMILEDIRDNFDLTDEAFDRQTGILSQMRKGYSENKAHRIIADYLWSGVSPEIKTRLKSHI